MTHPVVVTLAFIGAGGCVAFMILYQALAHWWRSPTGRHIMASMASLFAALMLVGAESIGWTDHFADEWRRVAEIVVISSIVTLIAWRIAMLLKSQLARHKE